MGTRRLNRGFTGLEMLIVVVVLGITFAMTLKGRDLVRGARAFVTAGQIREYQNGIMLYRDQYDAVPGDDKDASRRWGRPASIFIDYGLPVSFTGDLRIQGELSDYANASGEQFNAWRDLRFAKIVAGDPALVGQSAMPENLFDGVFGFALENLGLSDVICATQIPGDAAASIDRRLDDGRVNTGNMRGTSQWDPIHVKNQFPQPDIEPYSADKHYIICTRTQP